MKKHHNIGYSHDAKGLAANAGDSSSVTKMAHSHGGSVNLSGKQHVTRDAEIHQWGGMPYSQHQQGSGSMDYMSVQKKHASDDAKKLSRSARK